MVTTSQRPRRLHRPGMASVEVVLATGITLMVGIVLFRLGIKGCDGLYQVIGTLVGWPYL